MTTASEEDFPDEAIRRAWAQAIRKPGTSATEHTDARVVKLTPQVVAHLAIDEAPEGRFARVSVKRLAPPTIEHEAAVPLVAHVYLAGRFEPFPVDCVPGADGETLHYAIDLGAYKAAQADAHVAKAAALTGASLEVRPGGTEGPTEAELAAIALAVPFVALARTWDLEKVRKRDPRTLRYLSDRFLVPEHWIELQVDLFLADLAEGLIGIDGVPTH